MEWISVNDQLPEYKTVLCYSSNGHISRGLWNPLHKIWHFYNHNNSGKPSEKRGVTHWMELPKPPKIC